ASGPLWRSTKHASWLTRRFPPFQYYEAICSSSWMVRFTSLLAIQSICLASSRSVLRRSSKNLHRIAQLRKTVPSLLGTVPARSTRSCPLQIIGEAVSLVRLGPTQSGQPRPCLLAIADHNKECPSIAHVADLFF